MTDTATQTAFSEKISRSILTIGKKQHTVPELADSVGDDNFSMWLLMKQLDANKIVAAIEQVVCPKCYTIVCLASTSLPADTKLPCDTCTARNHGAMVCVDVGGNDRTAFIASEESEERFYASLRSFRFTRELEEATGEISRVQF